MRRKGEMEGGEIKIRGIFCNRVKVVIEPQWNISRLASLLTVEISTRQDLVYFRIEKTTIRAVPAEAYREAQKSLLSIFPKFVKSESTDGVKFVLEILDSHWEIERFFRRQTRLFKEPIVPRKRVNMQRSFRTDNGRAMPGSVVSDSD
jgi:hypothetical protein